MLDTHLIYVALTAFGIAAGAGILIAAAIIAFAAIRQRPARGTGRLDAAHAGAVLAEAVLAEGVLADGGLADGGREPALR